MEILVLTEKKKIKTSWDEFIEKIYDFPNIIIYPVGMDVLDKMKSIGRILELHDRIIVATAILHNASLITRDSKISSLEAIKVIW